MRIFNEPGDQIVTRKPHEPFEADNCRCLQSTILLLSHVYDKFRDLSPPTGAQPAYFFIHYFGGKEFHY